MKKQFILLLTLINSSFLLKYDFEYGRCPLKAGDIYSTVKYDLDQSAITGNWINIFDRK